MQGTLRPFSLILSVVLLSACATKPAPIVLKAKPANTLNQDEQGQSLSLVVRAYQLRNADAFKQITADKLMSSTNDIDLFASSLVERKEFVLIPGQPQNLDLVIAPDTQFIAIVGNFRQPEQHRWRYLFTRDALLKKGLSLDAKECYLISSGAAIEILPGQNLAITPVCQNSNKVAQVSVAPAPTITESANKPKPKSEPNINSGSVKTTAPTNRSSGKE